MKMNGRVVLATIVAGCGWTTGVQAKELPASRAGLHPPATRILHFPRDQYLGSLHVEDPCLGSEYMELGRDLSLPYGLNPSHVALEFSNEPFLRNQGLAVLKDLPSLEYLDLDRGVTDAGLKHVGQIKSLRWLRLLTGRIWGPGLAELAHLPRLERLNLDLVRVSKRGLNQLKGLTNLQTLKVLVLPASGPAIDEIPLDLSGLAKLKTVQMQGLALQDVDCAGLAGLADLEWLGLDGPLTENGLGRLKGLDSLKFMRIDGISCSAGEGLAHLADFPRLADLQLHGQITDAALSKTAGSPSLWSLSVTTDEPIRQQTIDRLKQALPSVEYIHLDPLPRLNPQGLGTPSRQPGPVRANPSGTNRPAPQNPRRTR